MGDELTEAVLADYRTAPVSKSLGATLGFLDKLTLDPDAVQAVDARAVMDAGVSEPALVDAIHVCTLFNVITRIADSLDFELPTKAQFRRTGAMLLKRGYRM